MPELVRRNRGTLYSNGSLSGGIELHKMVCRDVLCGQEFWIRADAQAFISTPADRCLHCPWCGTQQARKPLLD